MVDFRWLAEDVSKRPTRIYELVLLRPTTDGYHDSSAYMCGSVVLLGPMAIPRVLLSQTSTERPYPNPTAAHPVVWRAPFPKDVVESLVSWENPQGTIDNSELELTGGILHSDCVSQCFLVMERMILFQTDNTIGLWWQRKGSATCTSAPVYLLWLLAFH